MSWKRLFKRDPLIKIMVERGYVFEIDKELLFLTKKVRRRNGWVKNREKTQGDLLELIKEKPRFFDFIYKFLSFVFENRKYFKLRFEQGIENFTSMKWEHNHREDIIDDLIVTRRRLRITKKELIKILRLFFLAAPELFVKDKKKNGEDFYVIPKTEDTMYFLTNSQRELSIFYNGLNLGKRSRFLKNWLKLLRVKN